VIANVWRHSPDVREVRSGNEQLATDVMDVTRSRTMDATWSNKKLLVLTYSLSYLAFLLSFH